MFLAASQTFSIDIWKLNLVTDVCKIGGEFWIQLLVANYIKLEKEHEVIKIYPMGYDDREEEYYHKQYEGQKNELFEHDESQGTSHHQKYNPNEEELCCGWENFK